jgi:hypothetical protein
MNGEQFSTDNAMYHNVSASYDINDQLAVNSGVKTFLMLNLRKCLAVTIWANYPVSMMW